jgi:hypothetical protein
MNKITYDLAKQLKEAGFPFGWKLGITIDTFPEQHSFEKYPTLSELIEACICGEFTLKDEGGFWTCYAYHSGDFRTEGSTPEEAVAKLWLELNKKYVV